MAHSRRNKPLYERVTITDVGAEGKALVRINDVVVFTTNVIPGDIVDLQVTKKKSNYQEARVVKIHEYSPDRVEPKCEHFGVCGGCKWQNLPYEKQLFYKQKQVVDQLTRLGRVELPEISPIIGSATSEFYRNKLEYAFSDKRWMTLEEINSEEEFEHRNAVGFHVPGMFDKVVDVNKCWLQAEPTNDIRNSIREFALEHGLSFHNLRDHNGLLRNLVVRTASTGELMVIVAFSADEPENIQALMSFLDNRFPQITALLYCVNTKMNDSLFDQEILVYKGCDHIFEEMEGLRFKIGPKSFYQTNSAQAYRLYQVAREFADLKGNETVYDLYTGTGTIANFIARKAQKVIGIEYVPEAIEDAKVNAELNGLNNTSFFAGDMKDILTDEFIEQQGKPDVIITDPPRAGMHEDVVKTILNAAPKRIVYVSCNPATQARDLNLLDEAYRVTRV
ncbi:MAG: 23S rRNA (uracil(1939)-C(5))-methyltransferase RlmD, partial [Bacteroidota bacterium]|nr:23S rRNA (uracil(1939)-C(5))-methyltransferase RlmD [Bacteroidota bacterium]